MRMRFSATAWISLATVAGKGGAPTSTRWQPISSEGFSLASRTASSNATPPAISVVEVRMPSRCASIIPALTSRVKPKSSALTIRVRTGDEALEQSEFDAQEFFRIGPEIFDQAVGFARKSVQVLEQGRIVEQPRYGSLAVAHLIQQRIQPRHGGLDFIVQLVRRQELAHRALPRLNSRQQLVHVAEDLAEVVVGGGILRQLTERPLAAVDPVHYFFDLRHDAVDLRHDTLNVVIQRAVIVEQLSHGIVARIENRVKIGRQRSEPIGDSEQAVIEGRVHEQFPDGALANRHLVDNVAEFIYDDLERRQGR